MQVKVTVALKFTLCVCVCTIFHVRATKMQSLGYCSDFHHLQIDIFDICQSGHIAEFALYGKLCICANFYAFITKSKIFCMAAKL